MKKILCVLSFAVLSVVSTGCSMMQSHTDTTAMSDQKTAREPASDQDRTMMWQANCISRDCRTR